MGKRKCSVCDGKCGWWYLVPFHWIGLPAYHWQKCLRCKGTGEIND